MRLHTKAAGNRLEIQTLIFFLFSFRVVAERHTLLDLFSSSYFVRYIRIHFKFRGSVCCTVQYLHSSQRNKTKDSRHGQCKIFDYSLLSPNSSPAELTTIKRKKTKDSTGAM